MYQYPHPPRGDFLHYDFPKVHSKAIKPCFLPSESGKGLFFSDGPLWKNQRQFTHRRLQEFGFGKSSFESKILKEVECFINLLKKENGQATDFRKYIHASVANVIFSIVCGKRHDYDDEQFQQLLTDTEVTANQFSKSASC